MTTTAERQRAQQEQREEEARDEIRLLKLEKDVCPAWIEGFVEGWVRMRARADTEANDAAWNAGGFNW